MATALQKALEELERVAGKRHWVLVIDKSGPEADTSAVLVLTGAQAEYISLGLLEHAMTRVQAIVLRDADEDLDDFDENGEEGEAKGDPDAPA